MAAVSDALVRLYLDEDTCRVRLVGGENDGRTLTLTGAAPPPVVYVALDPGLPSLATVGGPIEPSFRKAAYEPQRDELGYPRRDDDGVFLYQQQKRQ